MMYALENYLLFLLFLLTGCNQVKEVNTTLYIKNNYTLTHPLNHTKIIITQPNVTLNLNGYTLKGHCNKKCIGIHIKSNAHNTTIINGTVSSFLAGISIDKDAQNTTLTNVTIINNIHHGIYIHERANYFSCIRCTISNNGTMGIYLDHSTHHALITHSLITNNGYRYKNSGSLTKSIANLFKQSREGIAIDSSQYNEISYNQFSNNALAAITLYKNCGEHGFKRSTGANYNWIHHNTFNSGNLHVASRQDRDLSRWDCSEPYILNQRYVRDEAQFNKINDNDFNSSASLIIHDDYNHTSRNRGAKLSTHSFVRILMNDPVKHKSNTATP